MRVFEKNYSHQCRYQRFQHRSVYLLSVVCGVCAEHLI